MAAPDLVGGPFDGPDHIPDDGCTRSTQSAAQSTKLQEHFVDLIIVKHGDQRLANRTGFQNNSASMAGEEYEEDVS